MWDAARERVLWVDIEGGAVLEGVLDGEVVEVVARHDLDGTVGAVVPSRDGRLLVAGQEELVVLDPAGGRTPGPRTPGPRMLAAGTRSPGPRIVAAGTHSRTNDGAVDPAGRFLIGTLALEHLEHLEHRERLVRVEDDGALTVLDEDLGLSNGLAWSPDGSRLYSVDTTARVVWVRDYDAVTGAVGRRHEHLRFGDPHPDGICMDADGALWVALWGTGQVRRYADDGELLATVEVDAPHTSSVAFVGPDLDVLLITTARTGLTPEQLAAHPDSGRLFTARVDAVGVPTTPWSGSWAPLDPTPANGDAAAGPGSAVGPPR